MHTKVLSKLEFQLPGFSNKLQCACLTPLTEFVLTSAVSNTTTYDVTSRITAVINTSQPQPASRKLPSEWGRQQQQQEQQQLLLSPPSPAHHQVAKAKATKRKQVGFLVGGAAAQQSRAEQRHPIRLLRAPAVWSDKQLGRLAIGRACGQPPGPGPPPPSRRLPPRRFPRLDLD